MPHRASETAYHGMSASRLEFKVNKEIPMARLSRLVYRQMIPLAIS